MGMRHGQTSEEQDMQRKIYEQQNGVKPDNFEQPMPHPRALPDNFINEQRLGQ